MNVFNPYTSLQIMKYPLIFFFLLLTLGGCKKSVDVEAVYAQMQNGQTKCLVMLDNEPFYQTDAVFKGNATARDNFFAMNFFNQYGGNYIFMFQEKGWYTMTSLKGGGDASFSNFMFGRVLDPKKNKGAGYLMMKGKIEPLVISKAKIVFKITGIAKRYPKVHEEDPSYDLEAFIIAKNIPFTEFVIPK